VIENFNCHSCRSAKGTLVLDLGIQPLANNLLRREDLQKPEPKFPLRLAICEQCWLLQIIDIVPPVQLFSEYPYFSSVSESLLRNAREATDRYRREFALGPDSFVIEIASNDGYFLQNFVQARIPCLGIEPAANIAKVAQEKGVETIVEFFGHDLAKRLAGKGRHADLILGNNVFAHVPDTNGFVAAVKTLLKPGGNAVLEFPYGVDLIEHTEFDTIYHEHVFYFTMIPLIELFTRHGLQIWRVERIPVHGGSLRIFIAHHGARPVEPSVDQLVQEEKRKGVASTRYYEDFGKKVISSKTTFAG
jgi:SAM-dependent methyltransferase